MIDPTDEMVDLLVDAAKSYADWSPVDFHDRMRAALIDALAIVERDNWVVPHAAWPPADLADDDCLRLEPGAECPAEGSPRCLSCVWRRTEDAS